MKKYLLGLSALALSAAVQADESTKSTSVDAEFGAILTSGNTESTALKGKVDTKQEFEKWRTNYIIEALYKEDQVELEDENGDSYKDNQKTAEKYFASAQGDYKLDAEHRGLFIFASYDVDKFSGYDYQATAALGYSDRLYKSDRSLLTYSVGPGYSVAQEEDTQDEEGNFIKGETLESVIVRLAATYKYKFSENAKFTQVISSDYAPDSEKNTKTRSETAITTKINNDFALKASYIITHNSTVPEDKENTDTQTALTLVYSF